MRGAGHTSNMTVYVGREPGELDVLPADRQGACVVLDHGPPRRANSQFSGEAPSLAPASSPCNYLFGASHRWTGYGRLGGHVPPSQMCSSHNPARAVSLSSYSSTAATDISKPTATAWNATSTACIASANGRSRARDSHLTGSRSRYTACMPAWVGWANSHSRSYSTRRYPT